MTLRTLTLAAYGIAMLGCQREPSSLSGTYSGRLESPAGVATVEVNLDDVGGALSGRATGTGLGFRPRIYYVTGSHEDGHLDLAISAGFEAELSALVVMGACTYNLTGQVESTVLRGGYSTRVCEEANAGTFELQRQ
jgi:hypothetical protein